MKKQPNPNVAREDVLRVIRRDFPHDTEADVLAILEQYGTLDWQREQERVHLAILKLADGDLSALRQHTDTACSDYRDVIAPAEYPAYCKHGWTKQFARGERAKTYESDWKQYQEWLNRE